MKDIEYIIVGDPVDPNYSDPIYKGSLVNLAGKTIERAQQVLADVIASDRGKEYTNLKIREVVSDDCWWNDPVLAN